MIEDLTKHLVVRPAFTSDRLFDGFSETLRSNGLLHKKESHKFKQLQPPIALFAASVMHNCVIKIDDDYKCKLAAATDGNGGTIHVQASVPTIAKPKVFMASSIYSTDLNAEQHCEQALLKAPKPWDFDIELGSDQKLAKLG